MIEIRGNSLFISFPEVHPHAQCSINFQRTLRVPDDNQDYPLPAGLGAFPLHPVDDYPVPQSWKEHGGVFLPMYQSEALWIDLNSGPEEYPFAIKIAAGKINAVDGQPWHNRLTTKPQDYVVIPKQPWIDGFCVSKGVVRQFVAMPLGDGVTAEEQITGEAVWGGLQIIVYPMKADEYEERICRTPTLTALTSKALYCNMDLGLAPGGRIHQHIAKDPFGQDVWDTSVFSRCFVHLANSTDYQSITGKRPPASPITEKQYADAKVPWFKHYADGESINGSSILRGLDGLASALMKKGKTLPDNEPIAISETITLVGKTPTARNALGIPSNRPVEMLYVALMMRWQNDAPADGHMGSLDGISARNTQKARLAYVLDKIAVGNVDDFYVALSKLATRSDGESYISLRSNWMNDPIPLLGGWFLEGCMSMEQKRQSIILPLVHLGFSAAFRAAFEDFVEGREIDKYFKVIRTSHESHNDAQNHL